MTDLRNKDNGFINILSKNRLLLAGPESAENHNMKFHVYRPPIWMVRLSVLVAMLFCFSSTSLLAQDVGVRAGVSGDPDQFYFGGHLETSPLVERLSFRPNVEIGVGDDVTLVAVNLEFAWKFPSSRPWQVYVGGGPALNIYDANDETDLEGGFNILLGLEHRQGLFAEFKLGLADSPEVKFGVGYTFR